MAREREQEENEPVCYSLSAYAMEEGVGRNSGSSTSAPSSSASTLRSSFRSLCPHPDTSHPASSSAGTSFPHPWWRGSPVPLAAPPVGKKVPDLEPAPSPPAFPTHLCPQDPRWAFRSGRTLGSASTGRGIGPPSNVGGASTRTRLGSTSPRYVRSGSRSRRSCGRRRGRRLGWKDR